MSEIEAPNVTIVGNGIVGLATAYALVRAGKTVQVISRDGIDEGTSSGNAAAIAAAEIMPIAEPGLWKKVPGMLIDPLGPLSLSVTHLPQLMPWFYRFLRACRPHNYAKGVAALAALMDGALDDHRAMLDHIDGKHLLGGDGALFVYRSHAARDKAAHEWKLRQAHGIDVFPLERDGIVQHEPALGPAAHCGYFTPRWATYRDPKELLRTLGDWLRDAGVTFTQAEVTGIVQEVGRVRALKAEDGREIAVQSLIVAAGAWSGRLSKQLGEPYPVEADRGYNTTLPNPGVDLKSYVTFSEDNFVAAPLSIGLRIGGAVEMAGLTRAPNYRRSKALLALARRYLPDLNVEGGTEWMGYRPGSPDSIPVISRSARAANVIYAFGHGHLGLTLSVTTGKIVAMMVGDQDSGLDMAPYRIGRFG